MKVFALVCLSLVLAGLLSMILWFVGLGLGIVGLPFHAATAGLSTANGIIDKTINADNAVYNYEWFKQQAQDIKALEQKTSIAEQSLLSFETSAGTRSDWTFEDKTEDARLRAVAQGIRSQYVSAVANYNARSSMATRDIFKDGLIPNVLETAASIIN
jgi:hypothetical protein